MNAWFDVPARQQRLHAACQSWQGTRFAQGMAVKGQGVDCVRFVLAALAEAGVPVPQLGQLPDYSVHEGRHSTETQLMRWLAGDPRARQHLARVEQPCCGDILAARLGRGVHHLGLASDRRTFWHCDRSLGVVLAPLAGYRRLYIYRIRDNFAR